MVPTDTNTFAEISARFEQWFKQQGGIVNDSISIIDYRSKGQGRGVGAIRSIRKNEILFSVPRRILLSTFTSDISSKIDMTRLSGWSPLILTLLYENSRFNSPWRQYLDILPEKFSTPMFWTRDELDELTGTTVESKIGKEEAEKLYMESLLPIIQQHPECFPMEHCGLETFHRMGSLIMAYSFHMKENEDEKEEKEEREEREEKEDEDSNQNNSEDTDSIEAIAMVPFADLLNADEIQNNARLFYEKDFLKMVATCDIQAGDQVYNTYGALPSFDLLRRYGYLESMEEQDQPGPNDLVEIDTQLICETCSSDFIGRVDYLVEEGVLEDVIVLDMDEIPPDLIITVATLQLSEDEFNTFKKKGKLPKPHMTLKIAETIEMIIKKRLQMYSTNIEDDVLRLRRENLSYPSRAATLIRLGEKRILYHALEMIDTRPEKRRRVE